MAEVIERQPAIIKAAFTVNPVYEGLATILRVRAIDVEVIPREEIKLTGEALTGEV